MTVLMRAAPLVALLLGCAPVDHLGTDAAVDPDGGASQAPDASDGGTSLDGTVSCGAATCTSGQLCVLHDSGIDGGAAPVPACENAPVHCSDLRDCSYGTCGSCAAAVCNPAPAYSVRGRNVECMGM